MLRIQGQTEQVFHSQQKYDLSTFLHIRESGVLFKNPKYKHSRCMPDTLFEFVVEGQGYIEYDGIRHNVNAGDCIISQTDINKDNLLSYGSSCEDPYLKLWFTADGKFIRAMKECFSVNQPITIIRKNVLSTFQNIVFNLSRSGYPLEQTMTAITTLYYQLFFDNSPLLNENAFNFDSLVDSYITLNKQRPPSLSQAAMDLGMSTRSFGRYFKNRYNISYKQYTKNELLNLAKEMLKNKNLTISQISIYCGFCDQSYFSNVFYKEFGLYPNQYRKQIMEENTNK